MLILIGSNLDAYLMRMLFFLLQFGDAYRCDFAADLLLMLRIRP